MWIMQICAWNSNYTITAQYSEFSKHNNNNNNSAWKPNMLRNKATEWISGNTD